MRKKKILKGFLWVTVILAALLLVALETGSRLYREKAAAYFRAQFTQHSDLVLEPYQTTISVWRHFPRITFTFRNISLLDTTGARPFQVLAIGQAEIAVPLTQFYPGRLRISRVDLNQVLFHQKVDSTGRKYGLRFRPAAPADTSGSPFSFVLRQLRITNARILTENHFKKSALALDIRGAELALKQKDQQLRIAGQLRGKIRYLSNNKLRLLRNQAFTGQVNYAFHLKQKKGIIHHTYALLNQNKIRIGGWHQARPDHGPGTRLNLTFTGDQPLMALFRELLPPQAQPFLNRMRTTSRLHLVYRITGDSGPRQRPRNQITFALKNGTFYLPASKKYIRRVNLAGTMDNGSQHGPQSSQFRITHFSAGSGPGQFQLSLQITNFLQPAFALQGRGRMELPTAAGFIKFPFSAVTSGTVSGAFQLRGNLPDTQGHTRANWQGQGEFLVRDAAFQSTGLSVKYRGVNARLTYTDNNLQLHNLSGTIGGSPFKMSASVRNYTAYIFNEPGAIFSQASIYAQKVDLDWLQEPLVTAAPEPPAPGPAATTRPGTRNHASGWQNFRSQFDLVVAQVKIPGREQIKNLTVKVSQTGDRVTLSRMHFHTTKGGIATAQGGFRLIPAGISRPFLDVNVHYNFLNLQAFMQNMTAFKSTSTAGSRNRAAIKKDMEEYLEKRYWLNLQVQAQRLQYLYLQGSHLVLAANMNRQRAALSRLQLQTLGGQLNARGEIQLNAPGNQYPLHLRAQVSRIDLQHLFRVAEQMQLDLLSSRNIQGTADCQLAVITRLDQDFAPSFDRTVAFARTTFRNMELIEVAPIQQALRFLRKERTSHLYFQDVTSSFILDDNKFMTPGFDLNSNLTDFSLSGSYTMGGGANLNMDVNVLSVLFGNNKRRIEKIQGDSTSLDPDTVEAPKSGRKQHLLVFREQNKYKVKLSSRKSRDENNRALRAEYSNLIREHGIDTVFRMQ